MDGSWLNALVTGGNPLRDSGYLGLVLDRLSHHAVSVLAVDACAILVRDPTERRMGIIVAASGWDNEVVGTRFSFAQTIAGMAMESGHAMAAPAAGLPWRTIDDGRTSAYASACAPVVSEAQVRGAIAVAHRFPGQPLKLDKLQQLGELAALSGEALDMHDRRRDVVAQTADAQVGALIEAIAAVDGYTAKHSEGVARLARQVGERLAFEPSELVELELAALLHDVGKVRVPTRTVRKPGPLTQSERALIELHATWGAELVAGIPGLQVVALVIRHHHERFDGGGYPSGLMGDRIPVASSVVSACDAYSAMTDDRPYRPAMGKDEAVAELRRESGAQFHPRVVAALCEVLGVQGVEAPAGPSAVAAR